MADSPTPAALLLGSLGHLGGNVPSRASTLRVCSYCCLGEVACSVPLGACNRSLDTPSGMQVCQTRRYFKATLASPAWLTRLLKQWTPRNGNFLENLTGEKEEAESLGARWQPKEKTCFHSCLCPCLLPKRESQY